MFRLLDASGLGSIAEHSPIGVPIRSLWLFRRHGRKIPWPIRKLEKWLGLILIHFEPLSLRPQAQHLAARTSAGPTPHTAATVSIMVTSLLQNSGGDRNPNSGCKTDRGRGSGASTDRRRVGAEHVDGPLGNGISKMLTSSWASTRASRVPESPTSVDLLAKTAFQKLGAKEWDF